MRCAVTQSDVAQLVGHDAGHFAFGARGFNHAAIDVHWAAGQSEGVDVARIEDFEVVTKFRMLEFRRNRSHQTLPDFLDVSSDLGIAQQRKLLFGFSRRLPALTSHHQQV